MSSSRRLGLVGIIGAMALLVLTGQAATPRFYADDPIAVDDDACIDASGVKPRDLSEAYDFLVNQFGKPGDRRDLRAVNVNTLDEVPDSSWFTNRIGQSRMSIADIARGPDL